MLDNLLQVIAALLGIVVELAWQPMGRLYHAARRKLRV